MPGVSDAAAIVWAIKNNMDSSACMDNQMKMYRKGVLDGKDKDTSIEEEWNTADKDFSFDMDNDDGASGEGDGPEMIDFRKGITLTYRNGDTPRYLKIWEDLSYNNKLMISIHYSGVYAWQEGCVYAQWFDENMNPIGDPSTFTFTSVVSGAVRGVYSNKIENGEGTQAGLAQYIPRYQYKLVKLRVLPEGFYNWGSYYAQVIGTWEYLDGHGTFSHTMTIDPGASGYRFTGAANS